VEVRKTERCLNMPVQSNKPY